MISDLNTYIQYLAALYFTICIDGAFFRRFWSPDYYKLVTDTIGHYKFQQSQILKDKLDKAIREQANLLQDRSVKRGVFMLVVCIFILVYSAFELNYQNDASRCMEWFPLLCGTEWVTLSVILSAYFLVRWRWVGGNIAIAIAIFLLMKFVGVVTTENNSSFSWVCYLKVYLVVFLIAPIVYQVYINWLYSQAYVQHLVSELNSEYEKYLKTNKGIRNKDKSLADECYLKVFADSYFDNNGQDVVITNFNQAVLKRLINACKPPKAYVLVKKWFAIKECEDYEEKIKKMETDYQLPKTDEVIPQERDTLNLELFEAFLKEYESKKGVPLAKFCKEKNIDLETFRGYRKKIMNNENTSL